MKYRLPLTIKYILLIFCTGILFFTCFRVLLCCNNLKIINNIPGHDMLMLRSYFMGLRFDTVISCYILALPALILILTELAGIRKKGVLLFIYTLLSVLYVLSFLICAADIPFFQNFDNRINITILNWTNSPAFMAKMVFEEKSYLIYFLLFLAVSALFIWVISRIYRMHLRQLPDNKPKITSILLSLPISLIFLGLILLGMRGRIDEKTPIMVGTAYFSNYSFPNMAGLNPVFTLMKSWGETLDAKNKTLNLVSDTEAIKLCRYYLHVPQSSNDTISPIARQEQFEDAPQRYNVVVVIMESMSAAYLQRFGNTQGLTPNLDRLATQGYSFDHFYSAGIHTFNGIFSTLYSFPALMARHTMEGTVMPHYTGLPLLMKQNGYKNIYFTTHDDQFDNVGGFLHANNFNRIVSKKDYPSGEVLSTLGVPDHCMFNFAIPILNSCYKQKQPFFVTMMTTSNHPPYIVPPNIPFTPKHKEIRGGCVEYADWAIGQFMDSAATQPWFANTIFVFLADHGAWEDDNYGDMALSLNHIPCIIYAPALIHNPAVINKAGGQIDVFPTIAGLLHFPYINNTMGIDLLHDERRWMYFSQDDKVGVTDDEQIYTWQKDGREAMYSFGNKTPILNTNRQRADSMKMFAFSMLQTTQWLLQNNKTGK